MCARLAQLQDGVKPHEWAFTEEALRRALGGAEVETAFAEFDRVPVGSGSIAQVYRARLVGEDASVAVKVRHPGVVERMWVDFAVLDAVARVLEVATGAEWMGLRESLAQFGHALVGEHYTSRPRARMRIKPPLPNPTFVVPAGATVKHITHKQVRTHARAIARNAPPRAPLMTYARR